MIIVLVNNDVSAMACFSWQLQQAFPGSECFQFVDPMLSLKYIANNHTDVVFAAERMRPANGIELLRNIRRMNAELPVIIIAQDDEMQERAQKLAADGYWKKPVTLQQLQALSKIITPKSTAKITSDASPKPTDDDAKYKFPRTYQKGKDT